MNSGINNVTHAQNSAYLTAYVRADAVPTQSQSAARRSLTGAIAESNQVIGTVWRDLGGSSWGKQLLGRVGNVATALTGGAEVVKAALFEAKHGGHGERILGATAQSLSQIGLSTVTGYAAFGIGAAGSTAALALAGISAPISLPIVAGVAATTAGLYFAAPYIESAGKAVGNAVTNSAQALRGWMQSLF